jgi:AcrR family transcriptional regulator
MSERPPRTQADRRAATRRAILAATVGCLVERGYTHTTTTEVARRAAVSQGAIFKHFPTKAELVAAAAAQLFDDLIDDFDRAFDPADAGCRPLVTALHRLWAVFCTPALMAVYRLYVEAPVDPTLRAALVPVVARHDARVRARATALFPELVADPTGEALFAAALYALQGLTLRRPVQADPAAEQAILDALERLADLLSAPHRP